MSSFRWCWYCLKNTFHGWPTDVCEKCGRH